MNYILVAYGFIIFVACTWTKFKNSHLLVRFSIVMYGLSLINMGFYSTEKLVNVGVTVLFWGLLFGWITIFGGAVYANIFYFWILKKIPNKDQLTKTLPIKATIIMLLLASLTVFFKRFFSVIVSDVYVYSWGWGAIFWGLAIVSIALHVYMLTKEKDIQYQSHALKLLLTITFIPILLIRSYQYYYANELERKNYLPWGAAFTVEKLMHAPYVPVPNTIQFTEDTVIELVGNLDMKHYQLKDDDFTLNIPTKFQYQNNFWQTYTHRINHEIVTLDKPKKVDYYYGLKKISSERAQVFLLDKDKNLIWQAEVMMEKRAYTNRHASIYPDYHYRFFKDKFDNLHKKRVTQTVTGYSVDNKIMLNESSKTYCNLTIEDTADNVPRIIKINGKTIRLQGIYANPKEKALCSKSYVFIEFEGVITVFDKQTMLPNVSFITRNFVNNEKKSIFSGDIKSLTLKVDAEKPYLIVHTNTEIITLDTFVLF